MDLIYKVAAKIFAVGSGMLMSPDSYPSGNLEVDYASQTRSGLEAPYMARLSGGGVVDGLQNHTKFTHNKKKTVKVTRN